MKLFSADYIFPVISPPIKNGFVLVDGDGTVVKTGSSGEIRDVKKRYHFYGPPSVYKGIICPGFVNAHCHLELSHLKGLIPKRTGLPGFLKKVATVRKQSAKKIIPAMAHAEKEMFRNGIVAVGDISNTDDSIGIKSKSSLHYHTFIELLGFLPQQANRVFKRGLELYNLYNDMETVMPSVNSITPHAPYTVSEKLFKRIAAFARAHHSTVTIHNQETAGENRFFENNTGEITEMLEYFDLDTKFVQPTGKSSLQSYFSHIKNCKVQLVHNVFTSEQDIIWLKSSARGGPASGGKIYFCLCPNANIYIENRLPDIDLLRKSGFKITLGTDSLASNNALSILEEMKTISKFYPGIPVGEMLSWATINGAGFLGFDNVLGSIEKGKKPGLNLIANVDINNLKLTSKSEVKPLVAAYAYGRKSKIYYS